MGYVKYNPNPRNRRTTDCVIRAIAKALGYDWVTAYREIVKQGEIMYDMPDANYVWGSYLEEHGFKKRIIPYICPECYTVRDFCEDHPEGLYVLGTGQHVVTVFNGDWFDAWNSGDEVPMYCFYRR